MTDFHKLRVFVAIAETGGFAPGAKRLRISAPAATRAIAALERELGAKLIERTTRQLRLTEAGERFAREARRILDALTQAEVAVRATQSLPEGELSITAPPTFGAMHVAPLLLDFLAGHPQIRARAVFAYHIVNLVAEGIDVAVRIGHLPDSSLIAVRVGTVRRVVVASPEYLDSHGEPRTPDDLAGHRAVQFAPDVRMAQWTFPGADGSKLYEPAQPDMRLVVNSQDVAIAAVLAGHGLTRALSYQVRDLLAAGRLRAVLTEHEGAPVPVHLVYPGGAKAPARVRAFVEFAAPRLRANPALNEAA